MIIKVRYHIPYIGETGHIDMIVCSELQSDYYIKNNKKIYGVFFDFYPENPDPLAPYNPEIENRGSSVPFSGDVVTLHSSVPFKIFCERMHNSSFASSKGYDCFQENCVHAVHFALKYAADLKIEMDNEFQCKNLIFCFWCPTSTPMPIELFDAVKKYKDSLEHTHSLSTLSSN